jgi:hypothetical protein
MYQVLFLTVKQLYYVMITGIRKFNDSETTLITFLVWKIYHFYFISYFKTTRSRVSAFGRIVLVLGEQQQIMNK